MEQESLRWNQVVLQHQLSDSVNNLDLSSISTMHCAQCWEDSCEQAKLQPLWSCRSSGGFERKTINKYMYKYQLQMVISTMKKCRADKMVMCLRCRHTPVNTNLKMLWKQEGGWRRPRDKLKNHEMCPPQPYLPGGRSGEATCVGETQKPFPDESWVPWRGIGWVIDRLVMCSFLPTEASIDHCPTPDSPHPTSHGTENSPRW